MTDRHRGDFAELHWPFWAVVFLIGMLWAANSKLGRIADALERAHPPDVKQEAGP